MAIQPVMTWEPAKSRWRKMYRGKVYTVSCEALQVPATKEQSYQAANAWWRAKKVVLDVDGPFRSAPYHPHESRLHILKRRADQARLDGDVKEASEIEADIETVKRLGADDTPPLSPSTFRNMRAFEAIGGTIPEDLHIEYAEEWFGPNQRWRTRYEAATKVSEDQSVGGQVEQYMAFKRAAVRDKTEVADSKNDDSISVSQYDLIRHNLDAFKTWIGANTPVAEITPARWVAWYEHVKGLDIAVESRKKRYGYARDFVWTLIDKGMIPTPPNLLNRRHRFGGGARIVPTMTIEEVRHLIAEAPGQLKLHLLLMANCGMTQVDISDLLQSDVNWRAGRIIRVRSKTSKHPEVPVVSYKLWPETFALLQKYREPEGEYVLLTKSKLRWIRDVLKADGKRSKVDAIKSNYVHIQKRLGFTKPMKLLRKTSATLIEAHSEYGKFTSHFLGHSPRSIKDRSYAAPSEHVFDEAVRWLGRTYGFEEAAPARNETDLKK